MKINSNSRYIRRNGSPPAKPDPKAVALDLMKNRDIVQEGNQFLHSNVALYISNLPEKHQSEPEMERLLDQLEKKEQISPPIARWVIKTQRDLSQAYTDDFVKQKAERLNHDFQEFQARYPGRVYIVGGIAEQSDGKPAARFGGSSDLDLAATGHLDEQVTVELREQGWAISPSHQGSSQAIDSPSGVHALFYETQEDTDKALEWFGHHMEVPPEGIDIKGLIREGSCQRGIPVDWCESSP